MPVTSLEQLQAIEKHLAKHPNQTIVDIATAVGLSRGQAAAMLYANQGKFLKSGRGGRHHPHTWSLKQS